jgi:hypothetical protein
VLGVALLRGSGVTSAAAMLLAYLQKRASRWHAESEIYL